MTKLLVGSQDINIDYANNKGHTALLYAIETANFNAIKLLIDGSDFSGINEVLYENVLKDMANKNIILSLINLFKLQKTTGVSPLLHAALKRDKESVKIMIKMDESMVIESKDSLASIMINLFKSIDIVNQTEVEIIQILLTHVAAKFISLKEKEMIMDIAISNADCELVELLLKFDFIISYKNLNSAVSNPDFLSFLLTKKHVTNKLNYKNKPVFHDSPLHIALLEDELESVKLLIQHGAYTDIYQALEDAVKRNQKMALQFIISEFSDQVKQKLKSPKLLHCAVINSALNIIHILFDHGADINAEYNGKYCLTQVVDVNILELLLSRGADPNIKIGSNPYSYPLHMFLSKEFKRELKSKWKSLQPSRVTNSFLKKEIKAFVQCLLKHGAQIDQKDVHGQTALHIAAGKGHTVGLFKILVNSGVDVNIVDNQGQSPIHKSVDSKIIGKLNCLVRSNATIDVKDHRGQTALHIAAASKSNSAKILKILIDSGADVNTIDNRGETPLSNAVVFRNNENLKILIDAGANVNFVRRMTGKPVLFDAADATILETLLDNGASVRTINGETPLSSSMALCCIGAKGVKRLIDAGCDVNYVNNDVNASGRSDLTQFVVIWLLSQLNECPEEIFPCVEYFIDHNANIDDVHFSIIHVLITFGCLSLIPKFITKGCAPTYLLVQPNNYLLTSKISPFMMALLMDQSELAQYFINIKYFMKSDIAVLNGANNAQRKLEEDFLENSLDLLKTVGQQPLSLETLCSVAISDILGPNQDRRLKIQNLELTQPVKDLLLFKNVGKCPIKNVGKIDNDLFDMSVDFFMSESFEDCKDDD